MRTGSGSTSSGEPLTVRHDRLVNVPFPRRIVEVLQNIGTETNPDWSVGSGYRIGGRYVLTASHVVTDGPVTVRTMGTVPDAPKVERPAVLDLRGPPDMFDVALLRMTDDNDDNFPWITFARPDRETPVPGTLRGCQAIGFPLYQERTRSAHDTERRSSHIEGDIPLGDDIRTGSLTLNVTKYRPRLSRAGHFRESPYAGFSGAAVTFGTQVIGVVGCHLPDVGHALEVTPIDHLRRLDDSSRGRWEQALRIRLDALRVIEELPRGDPPAIVDVSTVPSTTSAAILVLADLAPLVDNIGAIVRDLGAMTSIHQRIRPDAIVLPGRTSRSASRSEYAATRHFLTSLCTDLEIPAERVIVVPGIHDINANDVREYLREFGEAGRTPQPPYYRKWSSYLSELGPYARDLSEERPWLWLEDPRRRLLIAGMNSTMFETDRTRVRPGRLGDAQIDWFASRLAAKRAAGWTRVGVIFDSPVTVNGEPGLTDSTLFAQRLAIHLDVIVHGQRRPHDERVTQVAGTHIVAPGENSAGSYQILQFDGRTKRIWGRRWDQSTRSWGPDPNIADQPGKGWRTLR